MIRGRVQGVGFRYFAEHVALANGLSGWVRNRWNGDVETEVEGPREAVEEYLRQVRRGPALARVMEVEETWEEGGGRHKGFLLRPTE